MSTRCSSHRLRQAACAALGAALVLSATQPAAAQPGWVLSHQKISDTEGGFTGTLDDGNRFGFAAASLGDLDGDGVGDLAVGAWSDDDGGKDRGAVWVLFLDGASCKPCDTNCDGAVNLLDIDPFLDLLLSGGEPCGECAGDANRDGSVDLTDIGPFIACLLG